MPTFKAEEKLPGQVVSQKVDERPSASFEALREHGASESYPRLWQYHEPKHGLDDAIAHNYWRGDVRDNLRLGDEIYCVLGRGSKDPCEWQRVTLVVIEKPNVKERPVVVGILSRGGKITPCRGVGEAVPDNAAAAAA